MIDNVVKLLKGEEKNREKVDTINAAAAKFLPTFVTNLFPNEDTAAFISNMEEVDKKSFFCCYEKAFHGRRETFDRYVCVGRKIHAAGQHELSQSMATNITRNFLYYNDDEMNFHLQHLLDNLSGDNEHKSMGKVMKTDTTSSSKNKHLLLDTEFYPENPKERFRFICENKTMLDIKQMREDRKEKQSNRTQNIRKQKKDDKLRGRRGMGDDKSHRNARSRSLRRGSSLPQKQNHESDEAYINRITREAKVSASLGPTEKPKTSLAAAVAAAEDQHE